MSLFVKSNKEEKDKKYTLTNFYYFYLICKY